MHPDDASQYRRLLTELRAIRRTREITQAEIANRIGTTQAHISRLESQYRIPDFPTIQRYARALGVGLRIEIIENPTKYSYI